MLFTNVILWQPTVSKHSKNIFTLEHKRSWTLCFALLLSKARLFSLSSLEVSRRAHAHQYTAEEEETSKELFRGTLDGGK